MNKNICFVPFTENEFSILKFCPDRYNEKTLVIPKGIDCIAKNIEFNIKSNCIITNSLLEGIDKSEVIFISDVEKNSTQLYDYAIKALELSIKKQKEIICFLNLDKKELEKYKLECKSYNANCFFAYEHIIVGNKPEQEIFKPHKFKVPVIYINELIMKCNGYDIFIKICERLSKDGFKVLGISEDVYNQFFDYPTVSFHNKDDCVFSVSTINQLVYELYKKFPPDVILIKLPYPFIKYDNKTTYDYGLSAYAISQAVNGDACVCCTYAKTPIKDFWNNINQSYNAKLGYPIEVVHVSDNMVDYTSVEYLNTMKISKEDNVKEIDLLNKYNDISFCDLLNDNDFEDFIETFKDDFLDVKYGVIEW